MAEPNAWMQLRRHKKCT